eukprot:jgi/Mesvir1/24264/Mv10965-RA.1
MAMSALLLKLRVDDPLDAVGVHLGGGAWGTIAVGLFQSGVMDGNVHQLGYQLLGLVTIAAWAATLALLLLGTLRVTRNLRVSFVAEQCGLDLLFHKGPAYPEFLVEKLRDLHVPEGSQVTVLALMVDGDRGLFFADPLVYESSMDTLKSILAGLVKAFNVVDLKPCRAGIIGVGVTGGGQGERAADGSIELEGGDDEEWLGLLAFDRQEHALHFCYVLMASMLRQDWDPELNEMPAAARVMDAMGDVLYNGLRLKIGMDTGDVGDMLHKAMSHNADDARANAKGSRRVSLGSSQYPRQQQHPVVAWDVYDLPVVQRALSLCECVPEGPGLYASDSAILGVAGNAEMPFKLYHHGEHEHLRLADQRRPTTTSAHTKSTAASAARKNRPTGPYGGSKPWGGRGGRDGNSSDMESDGAHAALARAIARVTGVDPPLGRSAHRRAVVYRLGLGPDGGAGPSNSATRRHAGAGDGGGGRDSHLYGPPSKRYDRSSSHPISSITSGKSLASVTSTGRDCAAESGTGSNGGAPGGGSGSSGGGSGSLPSGASGRDAVLDPASGGVSADASAAAAANQTRILQVVFPQLPPAPVLRPIHTRPLSPSILDAPGFIRKALSRAEAGDSEGDFADDVDRTIDGGGLSIHGDDGGSRELARGHDDGNALSTPSRGSHLGGPARAREDSNGGSDARWAMAGRRVCSAARHAWGVLARCRAAVWAPRVDNEGRYQVSSWTGLGDPGGSARGGQVGGGGGAGEGGGDRPWGESGGGTRGGDGAYPSHGRSNSLGHEYGSVSGGQAGIGVGASSGFGRSLSGDPWHLGANVGDDLLSGVPKEDPADFLTFASTSVDGLSALMAWNEPLTRASLALATGTMRRRLAEHGGYGCLENGQGGFLIAFPSVCSALAWAADVQLDLLSLPWDPALLAHPDAQPVDMPRSSSSGGHPGCATPRMGPSTSGTWGGWGVATPRPAANPSSAGVGNAALNPRSWGESGNSAPNGGVGNYAPGGGSGNSQPMGVISTHPLTPSGPNVGASSAQDAPASMAQTPDNAGPGRGAAILSSIVEIATPVNVSPATPRAGNPAVTGAGAASTPGPTPPGASSSGPGSTPTVSPPGVPPPPVLLLQGLRVGIGVHSGRLAQNDVWAHPATGRAVYSGVTVKEVSELRRWAFCAQILVSGMAVRVLTLEVAQEEAAEAAAGRGRAQAAAAAAAAAFTAANVRATSLGGTPLALSRAHSAKNAGNMASSSSPRFAPYPNDSKSLGVMGSGDPGTRPLGAFSLPHHPRPSHLDPHSQSCTSPWAPGPMEEAVSGMAVLRAYDGLLFGEWDKHMPGHDAYYSGHYAAGQPHGGHPNPQGPGGPSSLGSAAAASLRMLGGGSGRGGFAAISGLNQPFLSSSSAMGSLASATRFVFEYLPAPLLLRRAYWPLLRQERLIRLNLGLVPSGDWSAEFGQWGLLGGMGGGGGGSTAGGLYMTGTDWTPGEQVDGSTRSSQYLRAPCTLAELLHFTGDSSGGGGAGDWAA